MSDLVEKLRLKEFAEEDVYFAKHDLELIRALHEKRLAKLAQCEDGDKGQAGEFEKRFAEITRQHSERPRDLLRRYRVLLDQIKATCQRIAR